MGKKRKNPAFFTPREIADMLNNAVVASLHPESLGDIEEGQLRRLRNYSQALVEVSLEHVGEGLLRPEELVAVLASGALYVHLKFITDTDKLPAARGAKRLYE